MRKKRAKRIRIIPDHKFNDGLVSRFINCLMHDGKKSLSSRIFYAAIDDLSSITGENGIEVWKSSLEKISPSIEVKRRRVGGATLQIPGEVRPERKVSLGMKWLIAAARKRTEKNMKDRLVNEILAANKEEGGAFKKMREVRKTAESFKAYSHLRIK